MSQRFICALSTTIAICYAITDRNEFVTSELAKKEFTEDKLLSSIVRARNSSKTSYSEVNDNEGFDKGSDKQPRTATHRLELDSRDNSSCCGPRYGPNGPHRPESYYDRIHREGNRYSSQYGERLPVDSHKYGLQAQGQPPGSSGSAGRPGGGSDAASSLYEGNQAGDRFSPHSGYANENSHRPGSYEFGGYGNGGYSGYASARPNGYWGSTANSGYGISGTFANGEEFGPAEPNYPEGNHPPNSNIQTQKAVALKALAGVALIGAAAALATNPVLLPIGIISGRRKRSNLPINVEYDRMNYILGALKNNFAKVYSNGDGKKVSVSPMCVARLACEIQKNYRSDFGKNVEYLRKEKDAEYRLTNMISKNVLNAEVTDMRIRKLIRMATTVALNGGTCNIFTCTFVKTVEAKNRRSILKF